MDDEKFFLLIKKLEDPTHRHNAIYDLMRSQDSRAEAYFIRIALDDSMPVSDRWAAMEGLSASDSKEAVLAVRKILETSESFDLVVQAIEILGLLKDTQRGAHLIKYLSPSYGEGIRYITAQALGRMIYMPAVPYLQNMLKEGSPVIRQYACGALITIIQTLDQNDEEYGSILSALKSLLNDPSEIIRHEAQAFLAYIDNIQE